MNLMPYELNDIYCGDSAVMLAALPDACIDLTVTSPPYDNLRAYNGFSWDFTAIATQLYRVTKPGGVVVWVVGDATVNGSETGSSFRQALGFMEIGFNLHDTMIWNRKGFGTTGNPARRYSQDFEYVFVLSVGTPKSISLITQRNDYAGIKLTGSTRKNHRADGQEKYAPRAIHNSHNKEETIKSNIWTIHQGFGHSTKDNYAFDHPAIFPESLARDHIISWSAHGDIVLDPFSGSGTTAKMSKMLQRQFIGFDISQEYVDLAKRRIAAAPVPLPFVMDEPAVKAEQVKLFCD